MFWLCIFSSALSQKKPLIIRYKRLSVVPADSWHQPLVNPDGTVQFDASFSYNRNNKNKVSINWLA